MSTFLNEFRVADLRIIGIAFRRVPAVQAVIENPRHIGDMRDAKNQAILWFEGTHGGFLFCGAVAHHFDLIRDQGVEAKDVRVYGLFQALDRRHVPGARCPQDAVDEIRQRCSVRTLIRARNV
jgi:hypothetical protein